ncbi:MAG: hypothetical protein M1813_006974 [Trichoglossum hirsutum]|nr:MAG: hypothetical protein M1813_006974 [Trichoglossum hirsutum]
MLNRIILFFVALLKVSMVTCVGTAFIENWCDIGVYVWSVADAPNKTAVYLQRNVGHFSEAYRVNANGGGISLKIAISPDDSLITQFEYTHRLENSRIYYDISNIDGYPFKEWGLNLSPSSTDCPSVSCAPGVAICSDVYNQPYDDFATKNCDVSANLTLILCPFQRTSAKTITATATTTNQAGKFVPSTLTTIVNAVRPAAVY